MVTDESVGEMIYRNIPWIKQAVDQELWIQKWTSGISTHDLIDNYIRKLKRTPFLEWNASTKTCKLRIGMCLFSCTCTSNRDLKTQGLLLHENGEWKQCTLCDQCIILFT